MQNGQLLKNLTDELHFAVFVSVIDAQMTSQRKENEKLAYEV